MAFNLRDFQDTIEELADDVPNFKDDDYLALWFLRAYATDNLDLAKRAVTGAPGDKGNDAILIDDNARSVTIVQCKYRKTLNSNTEPRSDIMAFAQTARELLNPDSKSFTSYISKMDHYAGELSKIARERLLSRKYSLQMYFVTLWKCSSTVVSDAQREFKRATKQRTESSIFEIITGARIPGIYRDYLDGNAPPIPVLDFPMENGRGIKVKGVLQRFDTDNDIECWVISMSGDRVADLFARSGIRLFAINIRGFLGVSKKGVNYEMQQTISKEPERFFYYNNGITVLCDSATNESSRARDVLRVYNPQVINGQQTTRVLAENMRLAKKTSVLVKVIQVPRSNDISDPHFDQLLSKIVAGTNWQNAISQSDLMANDRIQNALERNLRKIGYAYMRKRQRKQDIRAVIGGKGFRIISKESLARASAASFMDPHIVRSGVEHLFGEKYYGDVFPTEDPWYYLARYWIMQIVGWYSGGDRSYAKWLVHYFTWDHVSSALNGTSKIKRFVKLCEKDDGHVYKSVGSLVDHLFKLADIFYRAKKHDDNKKLDPSQFYRNRTGRHKEFDSFVATPPRLCSVRVRKYRTIVDLKAREFAQLTQKDE